MRKYGFFYSIILGDEVWIEEENNKISIEWQPGPRGTKVEFSVIVYPNGKISGKGARVYKDLIKEILDEFKEREVIGFHEAGHF